MEKEHKFIKTEIHILEIFLMDKDKDKVFLITKTEINMMDSSRKTNKMVKELFFTKPGIY